MDRQTVRHKVEELVDVVAAEVEELIDVVAGKCTACLVLCLFYQLQPVHGAWEEQAGQRDVC